MVLLCVCVCMYVSVDEKGDVILQDMVTFDDSSPVCIHTFMGQGLLMSHLADRGPGRGR